MSHVGDVAHVTHFVAEVPQVAEHHVESDGGTCVSQMGVAVNGGSAHVHSHVRSVQRTEKLFLSRKSVVYNKFAFHNINN